MTIIIYDNQAIDVDEADSLLSALLEAGHAIPHSCQAGVCQSCLMQAVEGVPPDAAQQGLKAAQKQAGFFLACQCYPLQAMRVALPGSSNTYQSRVSSVSKLADDVIRLRLRPAEGLSYRPGQFVNLLRDNGLSRSYSLASVPGLDDELEFHIHVLAKGAFSQWVAEEVCESDSLSLQGPFGEFFYNGTDHAQSLLMAGTGLAPLYGIVRDALQQGHTGDIHLYAASRTLAGLYLIKELQQLATHYVQFHYHPVVLEAPQTDETAPTGLLVGELNALIRERHPKLDGFGVYLCGSAQRVNSLRKQCFLGGAATKNIHYDLFIPAAD